jgi:hypothetical protein
MKFDIWEFSENMSRKTSFHKNLTRIRDTFLEDVMHIYDGIALNSA